MPVSDLGSCIDHKVRIGMTECFFYDSESESLEDGDLGPDISPDGNLSPDIGPYGDLSTDCNLSPDIGPDGIRFPHIVKWVLLYLGRLLGILGIKHIEKRN